MIDYRHMRSPLRDRLVARRRKAHPHLARPARAGQRRLSRRRMGLLLAFAIAIAVNLAVLALHGAALSRPAPQPAKAIWPVESVAAPAAVRRISLLDGLNSVPQPTATSRKPARRASLEGLELDGITGADAWLSPVAVATAEVEAEHDGFRHITAELKPRQTLAGALQSEGLAPEAVHEIVSALKGKFDFRRSRPGDQLAVTLGGDEQVQRFEYRARAEGPAGDIYIAERGSEGLVGRSEAVAVDVRQVTVQGQVHSTLYESMLATGEGASLISAFTEVFGWEIDFYREVQEADRFRILIEKRYVDDRFIGYGRLLAAEYAGRQVASRAFYYQDDSVAGYFNDSGESLQKTFLKSPVEVTRITSRFGSRKHPILGYTRAHNGVDYGVPRGTPVWTIGDGTVVTRRYDRGYGNLIEVRHPNGYLTQYAHLSKFANIKVGQHISQRQVIGYCGSTGLSTGPHVHFGMKRTGHYVDPLKQKMPRAAPLPAAARSAFARLIEERAAQLADSEIALAQGRNPGQG
ncbi:MAG: M23 family metallopeptidase [Pseudomonadota bacterium]